MAIASWSEQDRRENWSSVMVIGFALLVAGLLVVFFLPAGIRLGKQAEFYEIITAVGALGLALMAVGYVKRRKTGGPES